MPEGDTIHRAAASLRRALVGRALVDFQAPRLPPPLPGPGTTIDDVAARGKHLLIEFGDGLVLHSHMKMTGRWDLYRRGERWKKPRHQMRAVVATAEVEAVCFAAPIVEMLDTLAVERHPGLRRLGPDLCLEDVDLNTVMERLQTIPDPAAPIVDVLLDQRSAAGIGNVYKSELLFLHRVPPTARLREIEADTQRALYEDAARLLQRNLTTARRTTVPGAPPGSVWVYGRHGQPCRRCGTRIEATDLGLRPRLTAWCPQCQSAAPWTYPAAT